MAEIQIEQIKKTIISFFAAKGIPIDKIIFFGSSSNGTNTEDSDIDLIVLSNKFDNMNIFQKSKVTDGLEWLLVKEFQLPFDILYYSKKEWENSNNLIITEAKKTGTVIYS